MSERSDKVRLIDMLEAAEKVVRDMSGISLEAFLANEILRDAIVYRLQTIGEAAYNVSDLMKRASPEVDWFKIQGLRHGSSTTTRRSTTRISSGSPTNTSRR